MGYCPNCGAQVGDSDRYCMSCSADLRTRLPRPRTQNSTRSRGVTWVVIPILLIGIIGTSVWLASSTTFSATQGIPTVSTSGQPTITLTVTSEPNFSDVYVADNSLTGNQSTNTYDIVLVIGNAGSIPMTSLAVTITPPDSTGGSPVSSCNFSPLVSSDAPIQPGRFVMATCSGQPYLPNELYGAKVVGTFTDGESSSWSGTVPSLPTVVVTSS